MTTEKAPQRDTTDGLKRTTLLLNRKEVAGDTQCKEGTAQRTLKQISRAINGRINTDQVSSSEEF